MSQNKTTRRQFIKRATAASVGAISFPYFVPSTSLGLGGKKAPSERIVLGAIGLGGQGTGNMNALMSRGCQVVAVCDVETKSNLYHGGGTFGREPAKAAVEKYYAEQKGAAEYKGCDVYGDFRELLARKDIDAVTVCTPDHWHALISVAAAKAGKDIYCEKPLANSVGEGRAICEAVKKNKRVLQCGSHERSGDNARMACELVRNGRIGKLHTLRINLPFDEGHHMDALKTTTQPAAEVPVPEGFNYDMWLGHTPLVPYTPRRCHFWWRFNLAYGGGEMTDRGAHVIDLGQLGAGMDDTGPVELKAEGKQMTGLYNVFSDYHFECVYGNGLKLIGENKGPRGVRFEGDEGWIFIHVHGAKLEASKESLLSEPLKNKKVDLGRSPGHHQNFIDCVKSRKDPMATAEIGHRTASICHLLNLSMATGKPIQWDPKKEKITNDKELNERLTPKMRAPWKL